MPFAATIGLATLDGVAGARFTGVDAADLAGRTVASLGDINGDGYDDFAIGAYAAEGGTDAASANEGAVYVVFGREGGLPASTALGALDGTNGFVITGVAAGDNLGWAIRGVGDVDGDGRDDFVVGAPSAANGTTVGAGSASLILGGSLNGAAVLDLAAPTTHPALIIRGADTRDQAGTSLAGGDFNGDGRADIAVGVFRGDPGGDADAGEVAIIFGRAGFSGTTIETDALDGTNGVLITGLDAGDFAGLSIDNAGDVNGDGIDDLIIGAPRGDPGGDTDAGEAYVVFGRAGGFGATLDLATLNGTNGFVLNGVDAGDQAGVSVAGIGDVNGDGIDDLAVGAYLGDPGARANAGEVTIVYGRAGGGFAAATDLGALTAAQGFTLGGVAAGEALGFSVSGAGDVNGDGIDDLIVGAYLASTGSGTTAATGVGAAYVVFGRAGGFGAGLDLATLNGSNGFKLTGAAASDIAGISVSAAGDVNGDGYADVLVGAPGRDTGTGDTLKADVGEAYIVYGGPTGATRGTAGNDTLTGGNGKDTLTGLAGDDILDGRGGDDLLDGGAGADRMTGGAGNDVFLVDDAGDVVIEAAGEGNDTVQSSLSYALGANVEQLVLTGAASTGTGNALANTIIGTTGRNTLDGAAGNDTLVGGDGADVLIGGDGLDWLIGDAGADVLDGGRNRDLLLGGDGNDRLDGGAQRDDYTGGAGADRFLFDDGDFSGTTLATADRILDFSRDEGDRIDLRLVDARAGGDDNSFAFIGTGAFTGRAGQLRYDVVDGVALVQGDTNGDGVADFAIRVDGVTELSSTDFLL